MKPVLDSVRAYNPVMRDPKLVIVRSYGNRAEAELAKGALENAGIQAMIQSDTVGHMREHIAWSGAGFRIVVREEDAAAARDVLAPPLNENEGVDADSVDDRDPPPTWRRFT
jgi:putative signal transducing protein